MAVKCEAQEIYGGAWYTFYGAYWEAQTFTPVLTHDIVSCYVYGKGYNTPGDVIASVRAVDGNGKPTGSDLCSGSVAGTAFPTSPSDDWVQITFSSSVRLYVSTTYALVLRSPTSGATNGIALSSVNINPYTTGARLSSADSGATWGAPSATIDFAFQEWGNPAPVTVAARAFIVNPRTQVYHPGRLGGTRIPGTIRR